MYKKRKEKRTQWEKERANNKYRTGTNRRERIASYNG